MAFTRWWSTAAVSHVVQPRFEPPVGNQRVSGPGRHWRGFSRVPHAISLLTISLVALNAKTAALTIGMSANISGFEPLSLIYRAQVYAIKSSLRQSFK